MRCGSTRHWRLRRRGSRLSKLIEQLYDSTGAAKAEEEEVEDITPTADGEETADEDKEEADGEGGAAAAGAALPPRPAKLNKYVEQRRMAYDKNYKEYAKCPLPVHRFEAVVTTLLLCPHPMMRPPLNNKRPIKCGRRVSTGGRTTPP